MSASASTAAAIAVRSAWLADGRESRPYLMPFASRSLMSASPSTTFAAATASTAPASDGSRFPAVSGGELPERQDEAVELE